jgi:hypothetical protein
MLPIVIASSVIRSTRRGESHGGLYVVDFNDDTVEQKLDWNYPHIRWDSGGGDRGLRGMIFHNDLLYTAGATALFVFNKNFELVEQYTCPTFDGSHELFLYNNKIYSISNQYDAILVFDLTKNDWVLGYQHILNQPPRIFDPYCTNLQRSDSLHLDSISVYNDIMFYAGSTTKYIYGLHIYTLQQRAYLLAKPNTHNAQFWKDGIVFNRALESDTIYQVGENIIHRWATPIMKKETVTHMDYSDYARTEYTRGMVVYKDFVCIGTSPASVHMLNLDSIDPVKSSIISHDIRNSVCGMSHYPWKYNNE